MKKILVLILILLLVIPYQSSADVKSDEQQRVDGIFSALESTVKITLKSNNEQYNIELEAARGSGFFVGKNQIVTNTHVVLKPGITSISVRRPNGQTCKGEVGYREESLDLAILNVDCEGTPIPIAKTVNVGQDVYIIGSAEIDFAVTSGNISNLDFNGLIVADAYASNGNSGGPMINSKGEVIGVLRARLTKAHNFALGVNVNNLKAFLQRSGL